MVILHLVYVDDLILLCHANVRSFNTIKSILDKFGNFFELKLNTSKSYVVYSKGVNNKDDLSRILDISAKQMPFDYLGISMTGKTLGIDDCMPLISSLETISHQWEGCGLSYAGRMQLVQWIFYGKLHYLL